MDSYDYIFHGKLPAYRQHPESPQWFVMCPLHGYWASHGGPIGPRVTHCPICPSGSEFIAYPATDQDPPLPNKVWRDMSRDKAWRFLNSAKVGPKGIIRPDTEARRIAHKRLTRQVGA